MKKGIKGSNTPGCNSIPQANEPETPDRSIPSSSVLTLTDESNVRHQESVRETHAPPPSRLGLWTKGEATPDFSLAGQ